MTELSRDQIQARVAELGPWFHNLDLRGVATAPDGPDDYPNQMWRGFEQAVPEDLTGKTVLDIGCNGGFFSIEMKRRGASRVLGIDFDDHFLKQARFAAEVLELEVEFRQLSVYDLAKLGERFDVVIFMGVLYHLRHPLLVLDLLWEHVVGELMIFQTLQRGSNAVLDVAEDYPYGASEVFDEPGYPKMHFIEQRFNGDETNWWAPNAACSMAMLRSAGFEIRARPMEAVYICGRVQRPVVPQGAFPQWGAG